MESAKCKISDAKMMNDEEALNSFECNLRDIPIFILYFFTFSSAGCFFNISLSRRRPTLSRHPYGPSEADLPHVFTEGRASRRIFRSDGPILGLR
jgi:hypothetical protein